MGLLTVFICAFFPRHPGQDEGAIFGEIITAVTSKASSTAVDACSTSMSRSFSSPAGHDHHVVELGVERSQKRKRNRRRRKETKETTYSVPSAKVKKAK